MQPKQPKSASFTEITWDHITKDPEFSKDFFEGYLKESVPLQLALLRTLAKVSQVELAKRLDVKQTHLSRLEKDGSDHLISIYEKAGKLLRAKLALIPDGVEIVLKTK